MGLRSGMLASLGHAAETSWGTAVTVTRWNPLVSESVTKDVGRLESGGILAGRRVLSTNQWTNGSVTVSGDINLELYQQGFAGLIGWAFGGTVTTTSNAGDVPYTHTIAPGDMSGVSRTFQIVRPTTTGTTNNAMTYTGAKCTSWEIAAKIDEIVTASFSFVGKQEATNVATVAALYTNGYDKSFTYINGAITVGGSAVDVSEFTLKGDNGLKDDRRFLGSPLIAEPLEEKLREYTGELMIDWEGYTQYDRFLSGANFPMVATFTASSNATVTITTNVRFDGETPTVEGPGVLQQKVPVKCTAGTDAGAITVTIINQDAAP